MLVAENGVVGEDIIKVRNVTLFSIRSWARDQAVDKRNLCSVVENSSDNFPLGPIDIERIFVPHIE